MRTLGFVYPRAAASGNDVIHPIRNRNSAARLWSAWLLSAALLAASGCGGGGSSGGGGNGGGNGNNPPTANAGADQTVAELSVVSLDGSGTDPDAGDSLTYSWIQTAGISVSITNSSQAQASFTAPDVAAGSPETLTFRLTVSDGTASDTDTVDITVQEPGSAVTVSGKVNYEFVPPNASCRGLDFSNTIARPVRGATVQLIDAASRAILESTVSSDAGDYAFTGVPAFAVVRLRVRAELKKQGAPAWDVEVRDNYDISGSPPPLASRPLYVLEGSDFNTGNSDVSRNLTAATGWGGSSYTAPRAAAPFAVLDAIYSAMTFVVGVDTTRIFEPLDAFWSANNTTNFNTDTTNVDAGELGASFYQSSTNSLFLLGDANDDTEEFDDHIIVHEWGHYFEDTFSRSDSIGGTHFVGDRLDPRLAFGEGWATALAAMALDDPLYCDTGAPGSSGGFGIGAESGSWDGRGWYDEVSVIRFIYDLFDADDEGGDSVAVGFAPIYQVMTGAQATTEAFTTVFSFAAALRPLLTSADQMGLDAQLAREDMTAAGLDLWGSGELNDAGFPADTLPVFTEVTINAPPVQVCNSDRFDPDTHRNKLSLFRFLRFSIPASGQYDIEVRTITSLPDDALDPNDQSDPDVFIYRNGTLIDIGGSAAENEEIFRTRNLSGPDTYVAELQEFRYLDDATPATFPDQVCFDVSIEQAP